MQAPKPDSPITCSPISDSAMREERISPANHVYLRGDRFHINDGDIVRVAMTQTRIRIGCTEISVDAAREIMRRHAVRFPETVERWVEAN